MTRFPCSYDAHTQTHRDNSIAPEAENSYDVSAIPVPIPRHASGTPHVYAPPTHSSDHPRLPEGALTLHHDESNTHLLYPFLPTGNGPFDNALTDRRDLDSPQSPNTFRSWGLYHPPPDIPLNIIYDVAPHAPYHYPLNSTPYSNFACQQPSWSAAGIGVNSADEYTLAPGHSHSHALPHTPDTSLTHVDYAAEPNSGVSGASYPCQWTEGGAVCNVTVPATRSHMNRHLHTHHGFEGSDVRQARCHWTGCGEVMQQGSIARHMVTCHLQAKVTCPMCSKKLSRQDVISKHQRVCPAASARR